MTAILRAPSLRDRLILPEDPFNARSARHRAPGRRPLEFLLNPHRFGSAASAKVFECLFEGANGSTTFTDTFGKTITRTGAVSISTAQFADGTSSGLFAGGTADYLSLFVSTDFDFGSGAFRIRAKIRPATVTGIHVIATTRSGAGSDPGFWFVQDGANIRFICWGPTAGVSITDFASTGGLAVNTWADVEVQRAPLGGTFSLYINSVLANTNAGSGAAIVASSNNMRIGSDPSTTSRGFNGYMDTLQIFKGGLV